MTSDVRGAPSCLTAHPSEAVRRLHRGHGLTVTEVPSLLLALVGTAAESLALGVGSPSRGERRHRATGAPR